MKVMTASIYLEGRMRRSVFKLIVLIASVFLLAGCSGKEEVPAGKFPEKEIEVPVKGGTLKGTLMEPSGASGTLAIIVAGSGPTDRNGNNPQAGENNSLKMIAEALAEAGVSSFRYDKRGIAKSADLVKKEEDLIFTDYSDDIVEIAAYFKDYNKIVLIGHSEGAMLASVAEKDLPGLSGLVMVSGIGTPADVTLKRQLKASGEDIYNRSLPIIDSLTNGQKVTEIPADLFMLFRPSVQPYLISWFRFDPSEVMKGVKAKTLILQGDNDMQVGVEDARLLHESKPDSTMFIIPGMNHVLKEAPTDRDGNLKTYSDPNLPLDPEFKEKLIDFVSGL
jgi:hypothetical protein